MAHYRVGIDLGTSNTVVAYGAPGSGTITLLPLPQLIAPGTVGEPPLLPSVRYHPARGELDPRDTALPWPDPDVAGVPQAVVGTLARELGAQVPGRVVASAKSWLSHAGVDRAAPILPWGAGEDVPKVSPVAASASYLAHVRAAWRRRFPGAPLEAQEVVLTVPASFDEGARALTLEAARLAGLPRLRLLEEPQAACYDWLFRHREGLAEALAGCRLLLVCDVGGGTTDLTLIAIAPGDGGPQLARVGVGDHLMLGGDNMDLALAHLVEARLAAGERLSAARFAQLVQRCRAAKERLLAADAPEAATVTLLGAGARVIGAARSAELTRAEVERLVLDGFLPRVAPDAAPQRRRAGIVEFGLPYPADAAITRHLAAFLARHASVSRAALGDAAPPPERLPVPDAVLLNGGVFRSPLLAARLTDTLAEWRGAPLAVLANADPDVAVARGAVAFGLVREGLAPAIGGGAARSYYLVLDEDADTPRGVCLLPRGSAEDEEVLLAGRSFALRLGAPVRFHLVASSGDATHRPGEVVALAGEDWVRLPPIATVVGEPGESGEETVELASTITEVGTLRMHCVSVSEPARRWLLEFQLRGVGGAEAAAGLPPGFGEAEAHIERVFGSRSREAGGKEVRLLRGQLEHLLGKRESWDLPLARALFDALHARARRRRRSAEHERVWLNLAGYCLRPGFGAPLDAWRAAELWALYGQGLQYVNESQNWSEWWTLWRRAAGGLDEAAQLALLEALADSLETLLATPRKSRAQAAAFGAYDDMVRLAASLERVPVANKVEVGRWLLERLALPAEKAHGWWALGRVGARQPLYGSAHNVVPPEEAAQWLQAVLALDWKRVEPAAFAATQLARYTGDRARDLDPALRDTVARRLAQAGAPPTWSAMLEGAVALGEEDRQRIFGESLPVGLKLIEHQHDSMT